MMLAARGAFLAARRKPKLPYDAEVEYLESTGTQWIDTGVVHDMTFHWECDAEFTSIGSVNRFIGQTYDTSTSAPRFAFGFDSNRKLYAGLGNVNNTYPVTGDTNRHLFILDAPLKILQVDNAIYTANWASFSLPAYVGCGLGLFGRTYLDTDGKVTPYCLMRIYSSKHYCNGIPVRDFIPVRFTNELGQSEGAMYDLANPTVGMNPDGSARNDGLYRNRGTGAFLYGPT